MREVVQQTLIWRHPSPGSSDFLRWGRALGLLHDKGKERAAFQQYIRKMNGLPTSDKKRYDDHTHAFVGGILAKNLWEKMFPIFL